jgi:long-chain fatty acid transport protein
MGINRQPRKIKALKTAKPPPIAAAVSLFCLLCALAHPAPLFALGIRLPDQDAFATARGNAFAATADDPSAIYYNPAGITQLDGANLSLGMYGITYASRFTGSSDSINSQQQWAALPQTFSTLSFTNYHLAAGLGVYSPYGLSMEWPNNAPWTRSGQSGRIDYFRLNPVLAWQPCATFSIAAGAMLDYSQAELETSTPGFSLRGRATDPGFNVAILWHPLPQHSLGLMYRSATDMNYQGHISYLTPPPYPQPPSEQAELNFHFPQTLVAGYSYRPSRNWNLEADADWTDWSCLRDTSIQTPSGSAPLDFNWKQSTIFEFGATRCFGNGWRASAGYMFSQNSVPSASFNPLIPDSDRHIFSIGVGKTYRHLSWDAAYQLGYGPARSVTADNNSPNGSYEFFSNALSINLGWHF